MTDQIAVATFTTPAAPGTLDITDPSITDAFSGAIFIWGGSTTDNADQNHGIMGCGACTPNGATQSDQNASASCQGDNSSLTSPDYNTRRHTGDTTAACISVINQSRTLIIEAHYDSSITGGVRLNFTTATAQVKFTAILFAGLNATGVGLVSTSTSVAENTGAGAHFAPDFLFFFGGGGTLNVTSVDSIAAMGFALNLTGRPQVSAFCDWADNTEPTDADGEANTTNAQVIFQGVTRTTRRSDVSAFSSTGFTYHADTAVARNAMYFAGKFSKAMRMACATVSVSASTGVQDFNSFGFVPSLILGMATPLASLDTTTDGATAAAAGYFITGKYGSRAISIHGENGKTNVAAAPFNTHHRMEDVALLLYNHTGSVIQRATYVGGSSAGTGFSLNFSVASAAGTMTVIGFGPVEQDETVGITETSLEVFKAFQANETVGITESSTEVISAFQANETVGLLEGVGFVSALALGEIVGILDSDILTATSIERTTADRRGGTTESIALRGSTFEDGAELGQSLG